jgi:hypothetical protein
MKEIRRFGMHQFFGAWGVAVAATFLTDFMFTVVHLLGLPLSNHYYGDLLTGLPFFPIQILLGLLAGWFVWKHFKHRVMLWVWVLPLLILCVAFVWVSTLTPGLTSIWLEAGVGQSRLSHYFGWGCRAKYSCYDQLEITMPFYVSLAYSLGAWLAAKMPDKSRVGDLKTV